MLTLVYSPNAAARRLALKERLESFARSDKRVILFVPEQQVLEAEGLVCSLHEKISPEVSSFKRIANSIFRTYGGLRYHYIEKGAKQIVMWRALSTVRPALKEYGGVSSDDLSMLRLFVSTVEELKLYGISPERLDSASQEIEDEKLAQKTADISLLYSAYQLLLHEKHDDASDDLARAAKIAEGKGFFRDTHIILDSFDGFTPEEAELLRLMVRDAASLTVTLAYAKEDRRTIFQKLKETDRLVRTLAADCHVAVEEESLPWGEDASELAFFAKNIWQRDREREGVVRFSPKAAEDRGIRAVRCPGVYEEARFIAADIARRVRAGARYRDFAVVARNTDRYLGILDAALEGAGIPYFLSSRKDVTAEALVRMLFSALDIHSYHWRTEDVIAYMRCGFSSLSAEECDILEEYASVWRISGKRWYDDYGWQMNPRGFTLEFTEEDNARLSRINELREKMTRPLTAFFEAFETAPTVRSVSVALVHFLQALGIPKLLAGQMEETLSLLNARGEREEYALLYDCLLSSLDQLVEVAGDVSVSSHEYSRLLTALLSEADIGKLPSRCDEVTVGNADLLRKSDIRHVYVMGLCQGEFPSADLEKGCFDKEEKETLAVAGIETSPDADRRFADEKLYYYRAVTGARDSATLTYSYRDRDGGECYPSSAFTDTVALLSGREVENYDDLTAESLLYGMPEIYEYAVRHGYSLDGIKGMEMGQFALSQSLTAETERLPQNVTEALYGKKISLTQSKMDKFVLCPFAYHCTYSLRLSEGASGSFESVDIGNYVHKILETFFASVSPRLKTLSDEEAKTILDGMIDEYVATVRRGNTTKRFESLVRRLRRTTHMLVMNLLGEFRHSDFVPTFFELPITQSGEGGVRAEVIPVSDSLSLTVTGVVDRVDTYRKGNDVYLRVVDYKTGSKTFSMSDVMLGLNMQMLLYLFALASDRSGELSEKLGCQGKLMPAGVLYFSLGAKSAESDKRPENEDASRALMEKKIARSGVLLQDTEILDAMEHTLAGRYIPVTLNKEGNPKAGAATTLASLEALGELSDKVRKTVTAIATEIGQGKAESKPLKTGAHDPCKYCKMKPVCRMSDGGDGGIRNGSASKKTADGMQDKDETKGADDGWHNSL